MSAAWAIAALLFVGADPFLEPTGTLAWISTSIEDEALDARLYASVQARFSRSTSLAVHRGRALGLDEARLRACGGRFTCWLDVVEAADRPPEHVLVATTIDLGDGTHRLLLALFDVELARRARDAARARSGDDPEAIEALIFEDAVVSESMIRSLSTRADADRAVDTFVDLHKGHLAQARVWSPTSTLQLRLPDLGDAELRLEDRPIPADTSTQTLRRLRPGRYTLALRSPSHDFAPVDLDLEVPTSSTVRFAVPAPPSTVVARRVRLTTRWSGVALAAAGAALLTHALVAQDDTLEIAGCRDECDDTSRFQELGPFLEAPLGYSLIGAGATWTAGSFLEGEPHEAPWWSIVLGTVVGATAYALSAALD